jgi:hypothetical protein
MIIFSQLLLALFIFGCEKPKNDASTDSRSETEDGGTPVDEGGEDVDGESETSAETDVDSESPVSGLSTLAIVRMVADGATDLAPMGGINLAVIDKDEVVTPLTSSLQIQIRKEEETSLNLNKVDENLRDVVIEKSEINPHNQNLYLVVEVGDCELLRVPMDGSPTKCVVPEMDIRGYFDHDRSEHFALSHKFYLKFDKNGNTYFLGNDDLNSREADPKIFKLDAADQLTVIVNKASVEAIRGFDVNSDGAVMYWGNVNSGGDQIFIRVVPPDGVSETTIDTTSVPKVTRMLFFAADQFGGLIYTPELDQMSEHHVRKVVFDSQYREVENFSLTVAEGNSLSSTISWPILPKFDSAGRLFFLAGRNTEVDPGQADEFADGLINHLFMITLQRQNEDFTFTSAEITSNDENINFYEVVADTVFFFGQTRAGTQFFRRKDVGGGATESVGDQTTNITMLAKDSDDTLFYTSCDKNDSTRCKLHRILSEEPTVLTVDDVGPVECVQPTKVGLPPSI